jgi:hypothetical protein
MISLIQGLPVAATLKYKILDKENKRGQFAVTPNLKEIPQSQAVYFLVDDRGYLQKIGMTDNSRGLRGRMKAYEAKSGGKDATPNLYYRMMKPSGPLEGRSFKVHYQSFELRSVANVFGSEVEIIYTAHRFIESHLRECVRQLRNKAMETYPLWLEKRMYQAQAVSLESQQSLNNQTDLPPRQ